jgi:NACHT domain
MPAACRASRPFHFDRQFLDRPSELRLVRDVQSLLQSWLEGLGVSARSAKAIVERFPSYFTYALHQEWRRNAKSYGPLLEALDTPFAKASDREWAWTEYSTLLERRIQEGIFDEPFSLRQIYIPLNATYVEEPAKHGLSDEMTRAGRSRRSVVVSLASELNQWLKAGSPQDLIRVISGGPGSGKSSFARIFAARVAQEGRQKVLFVPLHLIDPSKDLADEVGRFVHDEGVLLKNPLDTESQEPNLLIIFDGLDELASQGKAAAETARAFVREVDRVVERRNAQTIRLRVLISGRELVVQENESEFRRPRQVLTLLPYFLPGPREDDKYMILEREEYHDPDKLLERDLRQDWWVNYGELTGKGYKRLPAELKITAQPLLNYLVALSFTRERLDFSKDINLNTIYADLLAAVHERGYEKHRSYGPIRHMKPDDFYRVLEEVGVAAWHGDGRTTTVREIEDHCRASGLGALLDVFQEGAKTGVTRLLAAFFFRQYGQRPSGDPTFVFTHKSFGEYLTARRVVRAIERVNRELLRRHQNPDEGWDERDALRHWVQICGPSAISQYLHAFLLNEMKLRTVEQLVDWQTRLSKLFGYMLRHGMPMEQLQIASFREALFQSRNAEESLLVALNGCSRLTKQISVIDHSERTTFGAWFKRIQGQRTGPESVLAARCLSFLDLSQVNMDIGDFYDANFQSSNLEGIAARLTCFDQANLQGASLAGASLAGASGTCQRF